MEGPTSHTPFRAIYSHICPRGILSFDQRRHIDDDAPLWFVSRLEVVAGGQRNHGVYEAARTRRKKRGREALMREHERNGHNRSVERDVRCHLATHASSFMPLDSGDRT